MKPPWLYYALIDKTAVLCYIKINSGEKIYDNERFTKNAGFNNHK